MSLLDLGPGIFGLAGLRAGARAVLGGLGGNMWGDGLQNGGCVVVDRGGDRVLYSFKQDGPADHPDRDEIRAALGFPKTE